MKNNQINFIQIKRGLSKKKKGFTLVELMVVLAIIATMTFIAVPNFTSIKTSVNEKVDKQSCEAIKRIITTFIADDTINPSKVTMLTYKASNEESSNVGINGNNLDDSSKGILNDALSDVKPPRVDNSKLYNISISNGGKTIEVSVGDKN